MDVLMMEETIDEAPSQYIIYQHDIQLIDFHNSQDRSSRASGVYFNLRREGIGYWLAAIF